LTFAFSKARGWASIFKKYHIVCAKLTVYRCMGLLFQNGDIGGGVGVKKLTLSAIHAIMLLSIAKVIGIL
jgi:hypothetical protein